MTFKTGEIEAPSSKRSVPEGPRIDGRRARSLRTRQLIIEAYLALARERSPLIPTATQMPVVRGMLCCLGTGNRPAAAADSGERVMSATDESPLANPPMRGDGRRRRSARTRQLTIEAYMALIREDPKIPTAAQIAKRAGCSVRSIFERFPDLIALRVAATDHAFTQASPKCRCCATWTVTARRGSGPMSRRGPATCERWLPLWQVIRSNQGDSVELKSRVLLIRQGDSETSRADVWAGTLDLGPAGASADLDRHRSSGRFRKLGRMRECNGLSVGEGCMVWMQAIDRLLPPTPASS